MTFIAWEIPQGRCGGKMTEDVISITYNEGKNTSLTFNQDISKEIKKRGFKKIMIYQDDITGEINLVIGSKGLSLSVTGKEETSFNYKLGSKSWVKGLCKELLIELDGKKHLLQISKNLSKTEECLSYRILKVL